MLRELSVSDCVHVSDVSMLELARLGPRLRYLSAAKCFKISDRGVMGVAKHCYKLRYLNVRGCESVSDNSLQALARNCRKLRSLDVGKCDVTDEGLRIHPRSVNSKYLSSAVDWSRAHVTLGGSHTRSFQNHSDSFAVSIILSLCILF